MSRKDDIPWSDQPDPFGQKVVEAVIEHITVMSRSHDLSFSSSCVNLQRGEDRSQLPEGVGQPVMMLAVCPEEKRPLRVNIPSISALFHKLDSLQAFTRLKGGRSPCLRFAGYWDEEYYILLDVFLTPDPDTMGEE